MPVVIVNKGQFNSEYETLKYIRNMFKLNLQLFVDILKDESNFEVKIYQCG